MSDNDKVRGEHDGREWSLSEARPERDCYPKSDSYVWGEFAGLAIELGGYADISMVDPHSGRRFWLADAFRCDLHTRALRDAEPGEAAMAVYAQCHDCADCEVPFYTALRRLIDAAEAADFPPRDADGDPGPQGAIAAPDGLGT